MNALVMAWNRLGAKSAAWPSAAVIAAPIEDESALKKIQKRIDLLLSRTALAKLRAAFGPTGLPFFQFYRDLAYVKAVADEQPDAVNDAFKQKFAEGLFNDFRQRVRMLQRSKLSPTAKNQVVAVLDEIKPWLRSLERNPQDRAAWRKLIRNFGPLIPLVSKDKGIYLKEQARGPDRWFVYRMMRPKEVRLEKIRDDDPALFEALQRQKAQLRDIEDTIQLTLMEENLDYNRGFVMGRTVFIAEDPKTGERLVYDYANQGVPYDEYLAKRKREQRALSRQTRVFPKARDLSQLRVVSEDEIEELPGPIEFVSLTDDKAKSSGLTRILSVKTDGEGRQVIVKGRYKGIYLDSMVNAAGRMIEGSAFNYNPATNRHERIEVAGPEGKPLIRSNREPYITVADRKVKVRGQRKLQTVKKLFVKIPSGKAFTEMRQAMFKLSKLVPSVEFIEKTRRGEFYFDPKDFNIVRDALQTFAMSEAAAKLLREYFKRLAHAEMATARENLGFYTMEAIGGFKQTVRGSDKGLLTKQKQALAWMEARGNNGVCALGTGVGKCVRGDTLISTDRGLIPIAKMNPGSYERDTTMPVEHWRVFVNGEILPVKNFYFGGLKPTRRIRTRYGFEVEGSYVHPLWTRKSEGEGWTPTLELREGDYLCIEGLGVDPIKEPTLPQPDMSRAGSRLVEFPLPAKMTPDLARLLGYIVGEGWTNQARWFTVSQSVEKNPEVRADLVHLLKTQLGWEVPSDAPKDIRVCPLHIRKFLEGLGVDYTTSHYKVVPPIIFRSSQASVRQFLRGLLDAEGYVADNGIEFSTSSRRLGHEVQLLLLTQSIVACRSPKRVRGKSHTYWRVFMTGDDARTFQRDIGFVSTRKIEKLAAVLDCEPNPNHDVIPHAKETVEALRAEIASAIKREGRGGMTARLGASFVSTLKHIRSGHRNPTYALLHKMLSVAFDLGIESPAFGTVEALVGKHYFYDPIVEIEDSFAEVMDIEVDDPRHHFVGNGFVNHNTLTSIAMMQKLKRDGFTEEGNGRFLYVCPKALRGNIKKEVWKFLTDEARQDLTGRLDILTYAQFRNAWKRDPNFANAYIALFFDEAQELRSGKTQTSRAALQVRHPRKILLTASPIEKEPMDAYVLAAIANNEDVSPGTQGRRDMLAFQRRFTETIGGRTVGVRQEPLTKIDLQTWVKQNVFYGDKQDVEEFELPKLTQNVVALSMDPEVEAVYRETIDQFKNVLRGMVAQFRFRGINPETGRRLPEAREKRIALMFSAKLAPLIRKLNDLANFPERFVPEVAKRNPDGSPVTGPDGSVVRVPTQNPKMQQSLRIVSESYMNSDARSVLFTDDANFVMAAARMLSERMPGPYHMAAGPRSIHVFHNGQEMSEFMGFDMPFREKKYKRYMEEPANDTTNKNYERAFWQSFVFNEIATPNKQVISVTLHGQIYQTGQNLQAFSNVLHLDRDTWNSEDMKQRTARAWRQGQQNPVEEYILDMTYDRPADELDRTLDEIRGYLQAMDEELFKQIIKDSQSIALGKAYYGMARMQARYFDVDRKSMELALSPYVENASEPQR